MRRRRLFVVLIVVFAGLQFVPVRRDNPPARASLQADPAVAALLRRACYNCHSGQTRWPWYSYVAPASFLVAHDVHEAREHLDFSSWGDLPPARQAELQRKIGKEVAEGEMPLRIYVMAHPEARLGAAERDALRRWADAAEGEHEHHD